MYRFRVWASGSGQVQEIVAMVLPGRQLDAIGWYRRCASLSAMTGEGPNKLESSRRSSQQLSMLQTAEARQAASPTQANLAHQSL